MPNFNPGDLVTSDRYGNGKVTGLSARPGYVLASFGGVYDNQYNAETGRRFAACGTDTIVKREAQHGDNL
jgi:hypothetical protein